MRHRLQSSQYLVLLIIALTASVGDTFLSRGMAQVGVQYGPIDWHHPATLFFALFNLNIAAGIVLLIGFFAAYTLALSWADLSFVMPATAFGYVVVALLSRFWLHEHLSLSRWFGIVLITSAVGFVAGGPSRTEHPELDQMDAGAGR